VNSSSLDGDSLPVAQVFFTSVDGKSRLFTIMRCSKTIRPATGPASTANLLAPHIRQWRECPFAFSWHVQSFVIATAAQIASWMCFTLNEGTSPPHPGVIKLIRPRRDFNRPCAPHRQFSDHVRRSFGTLSGYLHGGPPGQLSEALRTPVIRTAAVITVSLSGFDRLNDALVSVADGSGHSAPLAYLHPLCSSAPRAP